MKRLITLAALAATACCNNIAKANLLTNGNLDRSEASEVVPDFFLPKPTSWSREATRAITGPTSDDLSSEPWAGPAPTPVTTDGNLNGPYPSGYGGPDGGVFFRTFAGNPANGAITIHFYQDVTATPGHTYTLTGWAGAESNALAAGFRFAVDFLDGANVVIGGQELDLVASGLFTDNGQPFDYKEYAVSATAPAGAVKARARVSVLEGMANPAGGGQAFVIDDFSLTAAEADGDLNLGEAVSNVPGAFVSALYPGELAEDGKLYVRGKIKGPGVTSANDECILSWNGGFATVVAREGDTISTGEAIKSFGDPVYHHGLLILSARLLIGGTVTAANDDVLLSASAAGGNLEDFLREGDAVPEVAGYSIFRIEWVHPVNGGEFVGVTLANEGAILKKSAILLTSHGESGAAVVAAVDGSVDIDGTSKTIKSISRPVAKKPATYQTRVGNDSSIAVVIKTTTKETVIKKFTHTPALPPL